MAQRHVLGSLINHSFKRQNCSFETEDWASQDLVSADGLSYSKCIFIRATRDILPNEQLLVSYGASASKFPNLPLWIRKLNPTSLQSSEALQFYKTACFPLSQLWIARGQFVMFTIRRVLLVAFFWLLADNVRVKHTFEMCL
jgi:hypothetical protein